MSYWLAKTEPDCYCYADLVTRNRDMWEGVRNFTAASYMRQVCPGDEIFIYHTGKEKAIVAIARAVSEAYPDPTANNPKLVAFDLIPCRLLERPVTLKEIKSANEFRDWELVRQSRLSFMPVSPDYWQRIVSLATKPCPVQN